MLRPEEYNRNLNSAFSGTALHIAYGLEVSEGDDTYVRALRDMLDAGTAFAVPGKYLVEVLPVLQYLPEWFPGAAFKREAAAANKRLRVILRELFQAGKDNMVRPVLLLRDLTGNVEMGGIYRSMALLGIQS